jgi:hypothetical protein
MNIILFLGEGWERIKVAISTQRDFSLGMCKFAKKRVEPLEMVQPVCF